MNLKLTAYAKINLGLRILSRRSDGYHDLVTIFQRISLSDKVTLEKLTSKIEYEGPSLTSMPEDNLCYKAAEVFRTCFGENYGVRIHLEKNIPTGAGLGGGSSDAAAVLKGMAKLYDIPESHKDLNNAAAETGSDVPFFLSGLSAAVGEGRGEILSPIVGLSADKSLLIIKPGFSVSTAWAYRLIDKSLTFDENNIKIVTCDFLNYSGGILTPQMTNDFEGAVFGIHPELADVRDRLLAAGGLFAGLCGSGSAIYGVFDEDHFARTIAEELRTDWAGYVCRSY